MKIKKVVTILIAVLLLTTSLGMTVMAEGASTNPTVETAYELAILKTLKIDKDVGTYSKMNFKFEFEQLTTKEELETIIQESEGAFGIEPRDGLDIIDYIGTDSRPLDTLTISYERNDDRDPGFVRGYEENAVSSTTLTGEKQKFWCVQKKAAFTYNNGNALDISYYTKPGLYIYKVRELGYVLEDGSETHIWDKEAGIWPNDWEKEMSDFGTKERVYGSEAEYIIIIPVGWKDNIVGGELEFRDKDRVIFQSQKDSGEIVNKKVSKAEFTNLHQPEVDVKIKKVVEGQYASRTDTFDFYIKLGRNATDPLTTDYIAKVYKEGNSEDILREYTFTPYTEESFELSHDEYVIIEDVPAGTEFQVKETSKDYYSVSAEAHIDNQVIAMPNEGALENYTFVASRSGVTELIVKNTMPNVGPGPVTGILTDKMSFILLIATAIAGILVYEKFDKDFKGKSFKGGM